MSELITSSPFFYSLALTLVHFLWQGAVIALLLKIMLLVTDAQKPRLRYALASLATLTNLLVPITTFFVIYRPLANESLALHSNAMLTEYILPSASLTEQGVLADWLEWLPYLSFAWLLCVVYLTAKLLIELHLVHQLPKLHTLAPSHQLLARFAQLADKLKLRTTPQLLISLSVKVPMAIGWLKPVVLLPAGMVTGLTAEQLEMLLLHELAHVKRYDYLVNLLQTLVEILLFFHPAVGWVSNQMRHEREYCSDDIAVQHSGDAIAYAHTLTDTAALCQQHQHRHQSIPTMAMAASGGDLKKRVIRLVNHHCAQNNQSNNWVAAAILVFAFVAISSQHLISLSLLNEQAGIIPFISSTQADDDYPVLIEHTNELAPSSFAKQLLADDFRHPQRNFLPPALDSNTALASTSPIQAGPAPSTTPTAQASTNVENKAVKPIATKPVTLATADSSPLAEPQQLAQKAPVKLNTQLTKTTTKLGSNNKPRQKSIAELAFERTDSQRLNSKLANKYQHQINELASTDAVKQVPSAGTETSIHIKSPTQMVSAKLLNAIEPRYPSLAKRKGIELEVTVHLTIDKQGKISDIEFEQQSRLNYFRRTIKAAVDQWRFLPAHTNGKPVESQVTKIFSFSLEN